MLTVKEINEISFGKAGFSGYKPEDVDNFIDEVVESFQQLQSERDAAVKQAEELAAQNAELAVKNNEAQQKLAILAQKVESYRAEEDGIKEALISAQKLAKDSVQEAKDKAEIILQDAQSSARKMLDDAKIDAAKAAKEYMSQAETKKTELEEIKRQVSAFRVSLLEMYKKHLECINHIPTFRLKAEKAPAAQPKQEAAPQSAPAPVQEEPQPEPEPAPQPEPQPEPQAVPVAQPQPEPQAVPVAQPQPEPQQPATLRDRYDYTKDQMNLAEEDADLSSVGIDLNAYSDIPESLRREKDSHFSHLEFGDDVDLGDRKRRRK